MLFTISCIFFFLTLNKQKHPFAIVTHLANVVTDVSWPTVAFDENYSFHNLWSNPRWLNPSLLLPSLYRFIPFLFYSLALLAHPSCRSSSLLPSSAVSILWVYPFEVICWALLCSPSGTSFPHWRCFGSFYEVRIVWKSVSVLFIVRGQRKV